jgi:hypothetical protein
VRDSAAPPSEEARVSEGRATAGHRAERRSVVVVGTQARASADFRLDDLASSSGRLDALLRCVRAGLMVSHGLRADVDVYLVLLGGPRAPRTLRFRGGAARFLRPDERSLALTVQKRLAEADAAPRPIFLAPSSSQIAPAPGGTASAGGRASHTSAPVRLGVAMRDSSDTSQR